MDETDFTAEQLITMIEMHLLHNIDPFDQETQIVYGYAETLDQLIQDEAAEKSQLIAQSNYQELLIERLAKEQKEEKL